MAQKYAIILIAALCFNFFACATPIKPNIPYSGSSQELDEISKKNHLLAEELRKLPELQDGISTVEKHALKKLSNLYDNTHDVFDSAFEKMYLEGLPEVRKYCTPLQSLFWLLEDNKSDLAKESIENHDLKWLLIYAWADKKKERWGNYNTVVERLNSPRLTNLYQVWNFKYWTDRGSRWGNSKKIFRTKKGDCRDYTHFSVQCLEKGGYKARAIKVESPSGSAFHVVCEYKENGKEYIIDNSCGGPCGGGGIQEKHEYLKRLPQVGTGYLHN